MKHFSMNLINLIFVKSHPCRRRAKPLLEPRESNLQHWCRLFNTGLGKRFKLEVLRNFPDSPCVSLEAVLHNIFLSTCITYGTLMNKTNDIIIVKMFSLNFPVLITSWNYWDTVQIFLDEIIIVETKIIKLVVIFKGLLHVLQLRKEIHLGRDRGVKLAVDNNDLAKRH